MSTVRQDAAARRRLRRLIAQSFKRTGLPGAHPSPLQVGALVAQRLQALRHAVGMDRAGFAARTGMEDPRSVEQRLWRYETCRARAPLPWLAGLAEKCNLPVEYFVCADSHTVELHVMVHRLSPHARCHASSILRKTRLLRKAR